MRNFLRYYGDIQGMGMVSCLFVYTQYGLKVWNIKTISELIPFKKKILNDSSSDFHWFFFFVIMSSQKSLIAI